MSQLVLSGDTSGAITLAAPAIAGSNTLTLPASQGNLALYQSVFSLKNRLINGAMVIDQRNSGASLTLPGTTVTYTVDRWAAYGSQASKLTIQQNAGSVTPPTGFKNYLGVTVGASANVTLGASDIFQLYQSIEGYNVTDLNFGTASAQIITLSFWVRSSLTGTFSGSLYSSSVTSYAFTYSIPAANTWTQIAVTIPGSTAYSLFSSTNGVGLTVTFDLGAGSTYTTAAGSWVAGTYTKASGSVSLVTTNNATFYVTGVQLEVGSVATVFDYRMYTTELQLCQRYFYTMPTGYFGFPCPSTGGFAYNQIYPYKVTMRTNAIPSFSYSSSTNVASFNLQGYSADLCTVQVVGTGLNNAQWAVSFTVSAEL
jgi:hypothetical protein